MTSRVLPCLLVLATLAGCGGSEEPAPDPKPAYVERATAICRDADAEFRALEPPATPQQFGPYVQQTVALAERAQTSLQKLTPPPKDRAALQSKVLGPFAELVEQGKAYSAEVTAAGGDQARLLALLDERPTSAGIDKAYLQTYGLQTCADAIAQLG